MKKIAVLFSGKGTNFASIIEKLHLKKCEVVVAITNNPNAKGVEIAKNFSIPLKIIDSSKFNNREEFDKVLVDTLKKYSIDLTILAGFMRILTPTFTQNIKAIENSYYDDFLNGGVTVHFVLDKLDSGEIILQKEILKRDLTFDEYFKKIRTLEKEVLIDAIRLVLK